VIGFASIRFDHTLDDSSRAAVAHALDSRGANVTSWAIAGERTYARVANAGNCDAAFARELDARIDTPALAVFRVRPHVRDRRDAVALALQGPGRPQAVVDVTTAAEDVIVEIQPSGPAVRMLLAFVDEALAATPGRTIMPVLPVDDALLAGYAALRVREPALTVSRVLDAYVEEYARRPEARA
jgi:hypothetical protein